MSLLLVSETLKIIQDNLSVNSYQRCWLLIFQAWLNLLSRMSREPQHHSSQPLPHLFVSHLYPVISLLSSLLLIPQSSAEINQLFLSGKSTIMRKYSQEILINPFAWLSSTKPVTLYCSPILIHSRIPQVFTMHQLHTKHYSKHRGFISVHNRQSPCSQGTHFPVG